MPAYGQEVRLVRPTGRAVIAVLDDTCGNLDQLIAENAVAG
ncbi:hypothetical protein [uncultured Friedmanniella sp.]